MGSSNNAIKEKDDSDERQNMQQRGRGRQRQQLSASAHISRDQIKDLLPGCVLLPTVEEEERVPLTIDASSLSSEELEGRKLQQMLIEVGPGQEVVDLMQTAK